MKVEIVSLALFPVLSLALTNSSSSGMGNTTDFDSCFKVNHCEDNVNCKAKCIGSAAPSLKQIASTNTCIANCSPISNVSRCHTDCIVEHFLAPNDESINGTLHGHAFLNGNRTFSSKGFGVYKESGTALFLAALCGVIFVL